MQKELYVGVSDKILVPWLHGKEVMDCSDEGEAVGIGAGYFLATGKRANVFMSADGFFNALNPITSYVIPDGIEMNIFISIGRQEPQHKVATDIVPAIINSLPYGPEKIAFKFVRAE